MKCSGCIHYRRVKWGKDTEVACLRGLYGEWLKESPVDGQRLALAEGFGVQRRFDVGPLGCEYWSDKRI